MFDIINSLYALPLFEKQQIINIEEITSGLSQRSFNVFCENNQRYYAKFFDVNNSDYAKIESDVLAKSVASALTLPLLYSDHQWLITPFLQANDLTKLDLAINSKLQIALDLMLTFHKLTIDSKHIKPISFVAHANFYIEALTLNETQQQLLYSWLSDNDSIKTTQDVLCHGDLNFTNMLFQQPFEQETLQANAKLIDFECCSYAEIEYDIAMMIAVNNLLDYSDADSLIKEITSYLHSKEVTVFTDKVMRYLCKSLIINSLWYICRFKKTNDKKWQYLAQQQFKQADVLNVQHLSLTSFYNLLKSNT